MGEYLSILLGTAVVGVKVSYLVTCICIRMQEYL